MDQKDFTESEVTVTKSQGTYIEKDNVAVSISIVQVNAIETLWKLNVAGLPSISRIHHKAHGFFTSFTVVEVVITIDVQNICSISKDSGHTNLKQMNQLLQPREC